MELAALGALLGGAGTFAGGAAGLFKGGGGQQNDQSFFHNQFVAQLDWQKELARNGIQMRVADAKAAGLHPLYALGAPAFNPSPINVGQADSSQLHGPGVSDALAKMGQGVERAASAFKKPEEKALNELQRAQIENLQLQREHIAAQTEHTRAQTASILARVGQGGAPGVSNDPVLGSHQLKPAEVTSATPGQDHRTAGPDSAANTYFRLPGGLTTALPNKDLNIEEASSPGWLSWMATNRVLPFFDTKTFNDAMPKQDPGPGRRWRLGPLGWRSVPVDIPERDRYPHSRSSYDYMGNFTGGSYR